jgi:WD40 repeat protein
MTSQPNGIQSLALTSDNAFVVTGDRNGLLRVWDLANWKLIKGPISTHSDSVTSLAITPNGSQVIAGGRGVVGVWDVFGRTPAGESIRVHPYWDLAGQGIPTSTKLALTPDGTRVVIGGGDGLVRVYSLADRDFVSGPIRAHELVYDLVVTPDGSKIVTTGAEPGSDGVLRVWDLATGAPINEPVVASLNFCDLAVTPDSTRVVTVARGKVQVWELSAEGISASNSAQPLRSSSALAITPEGRRVIVAGGVTAGGDDGMLHVLDLEDLAPTAAPIKTAVGSIGHNVAVTGDGSRLVTGGLLTGKLQVWDMPPTPVA